MVFRILSSAEAKSWREEDIPLAERGVSLHWLIAFITQIYAIANEQRRLAIEQGDRARAHNDAGRWGRHEMPDMEIPEIPQSYFLNTHALVSQFVVPLTQEIQGPLYALAPPEHRGRPTSFISHTWNSLLIGPQRQRIGTLDAIAADRDEFVWVDFACYNQHVVEHKNISEDMCDVIKAIANVVVSVTPTPLYNRSWCLWELFCADAIGLTPNFLVCTGYRNDKIQAVNALYRSFSGVEHARSISVQAEAEIRDSFVRRYGSLEDANTAITAMLERQLGSQWHELQPRDGPLKFSAAPWISDPQGATLSAYEPFWEAGLMDSLVYGGDETVRELFAKAGVYIGSQESTALPMLKGDNTVFRLVEALQNEDVDSIIRIVHGGAIDLNRPLPYRGVISFEVAPPLHFLTPWADPKTIEVLLLLGANVNLLWSYPPETKSGDAAERERILRALLNGMDEPGQARWTALMLAVQRGDSYICELLMKNGASAELSCPLTGLNALHLAAAKKHTELVKLLVESGAKVEATLVSGITALHIAAIVGDSDSVTILLESGSNKEVRDKTGYSALDWARHCKHEATAELLI